MGVGEAIERQQQRWFIEISTTINEIREREGVSGGGLQCDPLMNGTPGHLGQTRPGDLLHQNT
jgi:hypothetical protein